VIAPFLFENPAFQCKIFENKICSSLRFGRAKSKYETTSRANDKLAKMLHKLSREQALENWQRVGI